MHAQSKSLLIDEPVSQIHLAGEVFPVFLKRRAGSRHMTLRVNAAERSVTLGLPKRVSLQSGLAFTRAKQDWIAAQLANLPKPIPLIPGSTIIFLGEPHEIRSTGELRGLIKRESGVIYVPGYADHTSRKVKAYLKAELLAEINRLLAIKLPLIDARANRVGLRETSTLWGSCTNEGNLSFSWRLIFAPYEVLDYMVSHEASHLKHMNHSARYWKTVESLCPNYLRYRDWLKKNGKELYRYV